MAFPVADLAADANVNSSATDADTERPKSQTEIVMKGKEKIGKTNVSATGKISGRNKDGVVVKNGARVARASSRARRRADKREIASQEV